MAAVCVSKCITRVLLKKPFSVVTVGKENSSGNIKRHLSLLDLLSIGIGGTVGSGVFVLSGLIARNYAGPGVVFSWLIAGVGCLFSAMSYVEFATVLTDAGSSYAYVYYALGELPAVVAAWYLCLEYGISGAAVSRSWGDKVSSLTRSWTRNFWQSTHQYFDCINIYAGILQSAAVLLLLMDIEVGKMTINIFTLLKLALIGFMIVAGLSLFEYKNVDNWAPTGASGIFRGATSAFFGFLGYDEVCCLSAEAKNPKRDVPRAIFGTIACVTILYVLASLALVGMVPYDHINVESGFVHAFEQREWQSASSIIAIGEIFTLPLVVVVSFLVQPRLLCAMAGDGLLPSLFAEVNKSGSLFKGTLVSGFFCVVIAIIVPFNYLDDMISAGVLLSFNLTNTALVVVRRQNPRNPSTCLRLIVCFNAVAAVFALLCAKLDLLSPQALYPAGLLAVLIVLVYLLITLCPGIEMNCRVESSSSYQVPLMPIPPLLGIFLNYLMIAQLSWIGICLVIMYTGMSVVFYFLYGFHHSVGNNTRWVREMP